MQASTETLDNINIHTIDRYQSEGYPWEDWAILRREAPVYWYERPGIEPFWAITRHADVKSISLDDKTFINSGPRLRLAPADYDVRAQAAREKKAALYGWDANAPDDFIYMDNPEHRQLRLLTARRFTSAYCRTLAAKLDTIATDLANDFEQALSTHESVDLVHDFAVQLPLATICEMMGVPTEDWADIHRWTDALFDLDNMQWAQPGESRRDMRRRLHIEFHSYIDELIERKRREPGDDLSTMLVEATIDNAPLAHQTLHGYLRVLIAAGNETTRNSLTRGILALLENRSELDRFHDDPPRWTNPLVEEVVRFTSPVIQFARTATKDIEMRGQTIRAGDTVGMWYPSANRDESVFSDPHTFDITREPNPHVGFGHGVHFCLGANLARFELRAIFRALSEKRTLEKLEVAGPKRWLTDLHVGAVAEVPVKLRA
ncbi:MAG: cytochrome P450 [Gammaproteobacteria bacterium]|nr:cytochrome P450 [Gammaproteobacteria bacterium]